MRWVLYVFTLLFKYWDISSFCYNYYDPEMHYQREFIRPSLVPTFYQVIPKKYFVWFSGLCDIITARLINSDKYLIYSMFLPADIVSFENLLLTLAKHGYNSSWLLLTHISVFYAPLLREHMYILSYMYPAYIESYEMSHKISLSITWFFHLNMFAQYSKYFYDIFYITMGYLLSIVPDDQKTEIILLFKPSNYKSYLLHISESPFFNFYLTVFILENYIQYLFRTSNTGNPNFINWCSFLFVGIFLFERQQKISSRLIK